VLGKVLELLDGIALDRIRALLPLSRAHFAVLLKELEGLDEANDLGDRAAHRRVAERELSQHSLRVDDVGRANSVARVAVQAAILLRHLTVDVSEEDVLELAEATLSAGLLDPGVVRVLAVNRGADQHRVDLLELLHVIIERDDLGRADEGEVKRVEVEDDPLAKERGKFDVAERSVGMKRRARELRGRLANTWNRGH